MIPGLDSWRGGGRFITMKTSIYRVSPCAKNLLKEEEKEEGWGMGRKKKEGGERSPGEGKEGKARRGRGKSGTECRPELFHLALLTYKISIENSLYRG